MTHDEAVRRRVDPVWRDVRKDMAARDAFQVLWATLKAMRGLQ